MGAPEVLVEGEILVVDEPRRLAGRTGVTTLKLIHELDGAPRTAALTGGAGGGGRPFVLSDLKPLLESGKSFVS